MATCTSITSRPIGRRWRGRRRNQETCKRLILFYKFAAAVQHFLLLLQKKTLAKENEPGGISISLRTSLNRPRKPLRFSWIFPAWIGRYAPKISFKHPLVSPFGRGVCAKRRRRGYTVTAKTLSVACGDSSPRGRAKGPMRIRTIQQILMAPSEAHCSTSPVPQALFSPHSFPARRKRMGRRRRGRNGLTGTSRRYSRRLFSYKAVSSFPNRKPGLRFGLSIPDSAPDTPPGSLPRSRPSPDRGAFYSSRLSAVRAAGA